MFASSFNQLNVGFDNLNMQIYGKGKKIVLCRERYRVTHLLREKKK